MLWMALLLRSIVFVLENDANIRKNQHNKASFQHREAASLKQAEKNIYFL